MKKAHCYVSRILTAMLLGIVMVSCIAIGSPVRSMLGARVIEETEESSWDNPYITDGLIAMYDGEWNYAGGVHSSGKVCNNIAYDIWHGVVGNNVVIGENYFGFSGLGSMSKDNYIFLGNEWFGQYSNMTFEVCFVSEGGGEHSRQIPFGGTESDTSGVSFFPSYVHCITSLGTTSSVRTFNYNYNSLSDGIRHTVGLRVGYDSAFVVFDGIQEASKRGCAINWDLEKLDCYIGCDATYRSREYPLNGKVFCVRVYSRALTLEEIVYNYNVDKKRFGL